MKTSLMQHNALMALLLVVLASSFPLIHAQEDSTAEILDANVTYIIEPFESLGGGIWSFSDPSVFNFTSDALHGDGALSVSILGDDSEVSEYEASWVAERHPHNCFGASELSLAVKTKSTMSIEVSILDDRECLQSGDADCTDILEVSTITLLEQQELEASSEWYHLSVPVSEISDIIDLKRIRGWKIRLVNATDTVLVDQFACHGGGSLLGAAFNILPFPNETSFAQAREENMWMEEFFESQLAVNNSVNTLEDGILTMDYVVQQVQAWGGFNDVAHLAAGNGYYNLSQATGITMEYNIKRPASIPERCIFRFVLQDGSQCVEDCDNQYHNQERWYSFNSIMDLDGGGTIALPLEGSTEATSTFWFTGWSGIAGNKILDLAHIKGYTIEVVLDSGLELYASLDGALELSNMAAAVLPEIDETCIGVLEQDLYFHEWSGDQFTRVEFMGAACCELCQDDPTCMYAMSNNRDCFIASELDPNFVSLLATEVTATFSSFWMDDPLKRGDWCDKCDCDEASLTIDCKGKALRVLPKTISVSWEPRIIDLQDNFYLAMIGSDSFAEVGNSLEEIRLPTDMKFLSQGALESLPKLNNVVFQGFFEDGVHRMVNAITTEADSFGDVCCGKGSSIDINWEVSLTYCDMKVDAPGIDAVYEPFYNYLDATILRAVQEDSSFMREAAESPEKCAEFCAIDDDCNYFTYDQRLPNAEHRCLMFLNNGTVYDFVCCLDDHYADEERTIPGTISGRPPASRHTDDNARVLVSTTELSLSESNNYATELTLSLGATPLRGAVWVYPKFSTGSSDLEFVVTPSHVPLYTSNSTAKIFVSLEKNPPAGSQSTTVLVDLDIVACDEAFKIEDIDDEGLISLSVIPMELAEKSTLMTSIIIPAIVIGALLVAAFLWYDYKRRQNDMIWMVKQEELHFASPPEVIGQGTFGLVLLAEYRGTQVAVKRVIPSRSKRGGTRDGLSSVASAMSLPDQTEVDQTEVGSPEEVNGLNSQSEQDEFDNSESAIFPKTTKKSSSESSGHVNLNSKSVKFTKFATTSDRGTWKKLRKNFIEEMRQLSKLRHPCICTVMGAVIGKTVEPMLIMEYMDHGSLNDMLKNDTIVIDGEIILPILRDISQGVRFLHSANPQVIHGDLKAANILVDNKFRAKVADFGLSQKKQLGGTGTPYWMAPELLRKDTTNSAATDVFSFGIILVEVYSRKDPYEGESTKNILKQIADKSIQRRPTVPEDCPPQIRSMISDCLVDEAEMRPTFEELDTRLKRIDAEAVDMKTRTSRINRTVSLFDIFPKKIAKALQEGRQVEAEHRDCVTIFFSDIVDFTSISSELEPRKVADLLDRLYTAFDALSNAYEVFKVETIGDAYMAVTNLVQDQPDDHTKRIAEFAIAAIEAANETLIDKEDPNKGYVNIRCGFHSGPVVADVVGNKNPRYCLFGDTVNSAHRMESNSQSNRINCSRASADLLKVQCPDMPLRSRGKILIKGKGEMHAYWVNDKRRKSLVPHPPVTGHKQMLNGMELALSQVDEGNETGASEEFLDGSVREETKGSEPPSKPSSVASITLSVQG